jgi:transcriptional regulator with XRE-family HTH domain
MLSGLGTRLKRIRTQRDVTFTELAAVTGISTSTRPRLACEQRIRSIELLLPILQAHEIPLDERVGSAEVGDPLACHESYESLSVLSGQLRLILADHDVTMRPREAAQFDTQLLRGFGLAAERPVEIVSILGRDGERGPVRPAPQRQTVER